MVVHENLQTIPEHLLFFRLCLTRDEDIQNGLKVNMFIREWH